MAEVGMVCLDIASFGPYQLWSCDKWKCPSCGMEVLFGFGNSPIRTHIDDRFDDVILISRKVGKLVEDRPWKT